MDGDADGVGTLNAGVKGVDGVEDVLWLRMEGQGEPYGGDGDPALVLVGLRGRAPARRARGPHPGGRGMPRPLLWGYGVIGRKGAYEVDSLDELLGEDVGDDLGVLGDEAGERIVRKGC